MALAAALLTVRLAETRRAEAVAGGALTVSAGIAQASDATGATDLLHLADQMMYAAKRSGKDRITVFPFVPELSPELCTAVIQ